MCGPDDNYVKNILSGDGVVLKYEKEDLPQVNPQLYKWLAIVNGKSSSATLYHKVSSMSIVMSVKLRKLQKKSVLTKALRCGIILSEVGTNRRIASGVTN